MLSLTKSRKAGKTLLQTLFSFLLVTQICLAQWYQQNSGTIESLNDVFFFNEYTGIAIGESGIILNTIDGGGTWAEQTSNTQLPLNAICFVDDLNGWVVGGFYDGNVRNSVILHTTNGGLSWTTQITLPCIWLFDVFFLDSNNGFAGGDAEDSTGWETALLKTTNGGLSWNLEYYTLYTIRRIQFADSNIGWVLVSAWGMGGGFQDVYKTEDAGTSWSLKLHTWDGHANRIPLVYDIYFRDSNNGFAVGEAVYRTTDGGDTWIDTLLLDQGRVSKVYFSDINNGTAVGEYGASYRTTDGGLTWDPQTSGTANSLNGVFFTDAQTGWAVGVNGTILHTTNGGVSFVEEEKFNEMPTEFLLSQNYPNPFNPVTKIKYSIPMNPPSSPFTKGGSGDSRGGFVTLKVYDILGNEIETLVNEEKPAGTYEITWYAANLPSGVYFYQLKAGDYVSMKKMILLK